MSTLPSILYSRTASNNAGNGLYASESIEASIEIFRIDRPLVSVLDSPHLKDACSNCYVWAPESGLGQFKEERGKGDCQAQAWKGRHRFECKIFAKLYPNVLPNTVRMVIQLLLRRQAKALPDSEWEALLKLQSHIDDFRSSHSKNPEGLTTWQTIELMSNAASKYSGSKEPIPFIQTLTARILINTLTLTTPTFDPLGLCVSPLSSLLNHSCAPNTAVIYSGPTLTLRSLAPIPQDSELTISYIDTTNPTPTRQSELQSRYFFTCVCPSCTTHSTNTLPDPPYSQAFEATSVRAIELQNEAATKPPNEATALLKTSLSLFKPYPPYQQPHPTILHTAFLNAITVSNYPLALSYALRAYFHIDPIRYPLPWHPVRVVRKWVLLRCVVQIAALISEDGDVGTKEKLEKFGIDWQVVAVGLFQEVEEGVGRSHGVGSGFAEEVRGFGEGVGVRGGSVERGVVEEMWGRLRRVAEGEF
ncbi:hypothetical protein ACLMJK_002651 [Lecanora helva]